MYADTIKKDRTFPYSYNCYSCIKADKDQLKTEDSALRIQALEAANISLREELDEAYKRNDEETKRANRLLQELGEKCERISQLKDTIRGKEKIINRLTEEINRVNKKYKKLFNRLSEPEIMSSQLHRIGRDIMDYKIETYKFMEEKGIFDFYDNDTKNLVGYDLERFCKWIISGGKS